jgi:hypothetical protein
MSAPPPANDNPTAVKPATGESAEVSFTACNYEASAALTQQKLTSCRKLLTFAQYIRNHSCYLQRYAGQQPSDEDRDGFAALGRQWRDLLDGKLLEGVGDVLTEAFCEEAEGEVGRLDGLDRDDAAAVKAREAWKEVLVLIGECKDVRKEVDELMAKTA